MVEEELVAAAVVVAMITRVGTEEVAEGEGEGETCGIVLTNIQSNFGDFLFTSVV